MFNRMSMDPRKIRALSFDYAKMRNQMATDETDPNKKILIAGGANLEPREVAYERQMYERSLGKNLIRQKLS